MRRPRPAAPRLKHLAFFEKLQDTAEETPTHRAAIAGLLTLRLIDHWVLAGAVMVEPESASVRAVRQAIMAIAANDLQREVLLGVVNTMQTLREVDVQPVLPRMFAYAGMLEKRGMLGLAEDVYRSIVRLGSDEYDADLIIDSNMRLGYCLRVQGTLSEAEAVYATAGRLAKRRSEAGGVFRSQIGLANVVAARGNLPLADEMFEDVVAASRAAGLRDVAALALHDQSVVAQKRTDFDRAVCLCYTALQLTRSTHQRERLLLDLGAYFLAMGRHEAARDALLVQEATAVSQEMRTLARINLMSLAGRECDSEQFSKYRNALSGVFLPPDERTDFLIESARGFRNLGDLQQAMLLLEEALISAREHEFHRAVFEAEEMIASVQSGARQDSGRTPTVLSAPAAQVELGLRIMAEAIAA
jgi:tetratricopeptide (TPR) repeat protein